MAKRIAIIGGTGKEGKGLAYRWAKAGHQIVIGSRQVEKAQIAADELISLLPDKKRNITGLENHQAADWCEIAVLTVPYKVHGKMIEDLKECLEGKILIDVTVPLVPPALTTVHIPELGSAALEAQQILGDKSEVVSAFQNISYEHLMKEDEINCDVLVCGNSLTAVEIVINLAMDAGMQGFHAGPLANSIVSEGLTSVLLGINRRYKVVNAGIKITGIDRE